MMTAFRYTESGPPVSTEPPANSWTFIWDLRNKTRGTDGEAWDVVLVKIHRDTAQLVMDFVSRRGRRHVADEPGEHGPSS